MIVSDLGETEIGTFLFQYTTGEEKQEKDTPSIYTK